MSKSSENSTGLEIAAIAIGGLISIALAPQKLGLWESIVGLIMLALLLRHLDVRCQRSYLGLAYAGTFALSLIATFGIALEWISSVLSLELSGPTLCGEEIAPWRDIMFFSIWLVLALLAARLPQTSKSKEDGPHA